MLHIVFDRQVFEILNRYVLIADELLIHLQISLDELLMRGELFSPDYSFCSFHHCICLILLLEVVLFTSFKQLLEVFHDFMATLRQVDSADDLLERSSTIGDLLSECEEFGAIKEWEIHVHTIFFDAQALDICVHIKLLEHVEFLVKFLHFLGHLDRSESRCLVSGVGKLIVHVICGLL